MILIYIFQCIENALKSHRDFGDRGIFLLFLNAFSTTLENEIINEPKMLEII